MSKTSPLRWRFEEQHGKRAQKHLKSPSKHLFHIHWSLWRQLCCKRSLLVISQILWLFADILTANDKYRVINKDNLTIPIHMELSQNQKKFSWCFSAFLKSRLNFEHFEKKDDPHRFCISEITDFEKVVWKMSKKCCFREPFHNQHGKPAITFLKSASQQFYQIYW